MIAVFDGASARGDTKAMSKCVRIMHDLGRSSRLVQVSMLSVQGAGCWVLGVGCRVSHTHPPCCTSPLPPYLDLPPYGPPIPRPEPLNPALACPPSLQLFVFSRPTLAHLEPPTPAVSSSSRHMAGSAPGPHASPPSSHFPTSSSHPPSPSLPDTSSPRTKAALQGLTDLTLQLAATVEQEVQGAGWSKRYRV